MEDTKDLKKQIKELEAENEYLKKKTAPYRAILEFDMNDFESKAELQRALNAWKYQSVIHEFDQYLRAHTKHGGYTEEEHWPKPAKAGDLYVLDDYMPPPFDANVVDHIYSLIRSKLWNFVNEEGVDLD